ncbi:SH3 domain-containing protein [Fredinandcohnia sp. 179-A 10B2 NHS]|uniref:SH3 domain-containing protein n=1 Tax=Fredinandcohnia sp. 179-A 10B2 NHS TaxID=3235176 RepID=UPI0039A3DD99
MSVRGILMCLVALFLLNQPVSADSATTYVATDKLPLYRSFEELSDYNLHLPLYNPGYTRLAELYFGDSVTILEEYRYGVKVRTSAGQEGWVQKAYLSTNPESITWLVKYERALREQPSTGATQIGMIPDKTRVNVLDYEYVKTEQYKDWYKVQTASGQVGWIWGAAYIDGDWSNRGYNIIRYEFDKSGIVTNNLSVFSPLDSVANVTAGELNRYIASRDSGKTTLMTNKGSSFVEAQNITGLNAIYLMAHAGHESNWGKSAIVSSKYNYYGIGAIDSKPAQGAYTFDTPEGGIKAGAIWIANNYIIRAWDTDRVYPLYQSTLDNMKNDNGGWHQYATDEAWAVKIAAFIQDFYNYTYPNGFSLKKGWVLDGNEYYYFDNNGKMFLGWLPWNGKWYYLKQNGYMAKGWQYDKGDWYYLKSDGAMQTGWVLDKGKWYYLLNSGKMAKSTWFYYGNKWYYFSKSGEMQTGWLLDKGKWYFFNKDGIMQTGWVNQNGTWYFLTNDGAMLTGWFYYGGSWYYLANSGAMQTGWELIDNKWYYFYSGGNMAKNTTIDGYRLGSDGAWIR